MFCPQPPFANDDIALSTYSVDEALVFGLGDWSGFDNFSQIFRAHEGTVVVDDVSPGELGVKLQNVSLREVVGDAPDGMAVPKGCQFSLTQEFSIFAALDS